MVDGQVARKRHRDDTTAVRRDVDQDDGVRAGPLGLGGIAGAELRVLSRPRVRADDEVVLVAVLVLPALDVVVVAIDG